MTPDKEENPFLSLFGNFSQAGKVTWIGTRPKSGVPMDSLSEVLVEKNGLKGDRANKTSATGKRQVTLIQKEHIAAVASFLGLTEIDPALLRRNIVVAGINLNALKNQKFKIGTATLEMTGFCYPCSKMEKNLGHGGFNAMRGHGGITCRVIEEGIIKINDQISILNQTENPQQSLFSK
jgi:MOSC domain-containing protein YiiM